MAAKYFENKEYVPRTRLEHWCADCDREKVDSTDKETGSFFVFFGTPFSQTRQEYDDDVNYGGFIFALCKKCNVPAVKVD